jgi:4'-phosphopantetheinyl transferase
VTAAGAGAAAWTDDPPEASPGATHLWICDLEALREPALLESYDCLLDAQERRRAGRFVFERDRHRFLVSHALLRHVLSLYGGLAPREWRFVEGVHGKPGLAIGQGDGMPAFNLSHSGSLGLLAVHAGTASLGADIEFHRPARDFGALARRYFAPAEAARLNGLAGEALASEFYDFWTLKEAFVKARGDGLRQSLADFWFDLDRSARGLRFEAVATLEPEPWRWRFWSWRPCAAFSAALALLPDASCAAVSEPRWFEAVPGRSWRALEIACTLSGNRRITGN